MAGFGNYLYDMKYGCAESKKYCQKYFKMINYRAVQEFIQGNFKNFILMLTLVN